MSDEFEGSAPAEGGSEAPSAPAPAPAPQFDPAALQSQITEAIKGGFASYQPPQQRPQYIPVAPPQQPPPDPVRDLIVPYLAPVARHLALQSELAADASVFYAKTPSAVKYSDQIEEVVLQRANAGQPVSRAQAWSYLRGSVLFEDLVQETIKERTDAAARARNNTILGPGLVRTPTGPVKDAAEATDSELEEFLKNRPF